MLLEKIKETEQTNDKKEDKINDLLSKLNQKEKISDNVHSINLQQKKAISELEQFLEIKDLEIIRLRNIKWYQKLLGKK